jgi:hypothetical protein
MGFRSVFLLFLTLTVPVFAQSSGSAVQTPSDEASSPKSDSSAASAAKLDLTPDANGKLCEPRMQQLFRVVAEKDEENDKLLHDYTYTERDVQKTLDRKGKVKSTEIKTYDVMEVYGEPVQRLIAKDDKPLSVKDTAKEDEKIQKIIDKRKGESEEARKKREEREEKDRKQAREFVTEVADAYNFKLVGSEQLDGREAWVIDGEPRPGFEPHMREAKFLSKFHGRVWIDKSDLQLVKMDVEAIDNVSVGWVLARIHKGARVMYEQTRINDEVWLPQHLTFNVDGRFALVKGFNVDGEQTFRDYKKFRTSSRIVGVGKIVKDPQ